MTENIDLGDFPNVIAGLFDQLLGNAMQGATYNEYVDSQFLDVSEEVGEAVGAYRRYRGFARRAGSLDEVMSELADVIISAAVAMTALGTESAISSALSAKLEIIFKRGWVNKGV